jgi:hypothetical protein
MILQEELDEETPREIGTNSGDGTPLKRHRIGFLHRHRVVLLPDEKSA